MKPQKTQPRLATWPTDYPLVRLKGVEVRTAQVQRLQAGRPAERDNGHPRLGNLDAEDHGGFAGSNATAPPMCSISRITSWCGGIIGYVAGTELRLADQAPASTRRRVEIDGEKK
jgi:hypothetical protein